MIKFGSVLRNISLLLLVVISTSCIDLLHELKIKKDKSGTAFIGIESNALGMFGNIASDYIDEETKVNLAKIPLSNIEKLKNIKGISNIEAMTQPKQGRIGFRFDFDSPAALNRAYYALGNKQAAFYYPDVVKISKHRVKVRNIEPFIKYYLEKEQPKLLKNSYIKYLNVRMDIEIEGEVNKESIKLGTLNGTKNRVSFRYPLQQVLDQKTSIGTQFRYK